MEPIDSWPLKNAIDVTSRLLQMVNDTHVRHVRTAVAVLSENDDAVAPKVEARLSSDLKEFTVRMCWKSSKHILYVETDNDPGSKPVYQLLSTESIDSLIEHGENLRRARELAVQVSRESDEDYLAVLKEL